MKNHIIIDLDYYNEVYQRYLQGLTEWRPGPEPLEVRISKETYAKHAALECGYQKWLQRNQQQKDSE